MMHWRWLFLAINDLINEEGFHLKIWQNFLHSFVSTKFYFITAPNQAHNPFLQSVYYSMSVWTRSSQLWRTLTKFVLSPKSIKLIHVILATIQVSPSTFAIDYFQFAIHHVVTCSISTHNQQMKIQSRRSFLQSFKFLRPEPVQMFLSLYFTAMCLPDCLSRTFHIGSLQKLATALNFMARGRKIDFF